MSELIKKDNHLQRAIAYAQKLNWKNMVLQTVEYYKSQGIPESVVYDKKIVPEDPIYSLITFEYFKSFKKDLKVRIGRLEEALEKDNFDSLALEFIKSGNSKIFGDQGKGIWDDLGDYLTLARFNPRISWTGIKGDKYNAPTPEKEI